MPKSLDEKLRQEFFDNSSSSWHDFIKTIPEHEEHASTLLTQLVGELETGTHGILELAFFDYPELHASVFEFIKRQVTEDASGDNDAITAFLWQLKDEKSDVDAQRPLRKDFWQPLLEQDVFSRDIWQVIEKKQRSPIQQFLLALSEKLANPPQKVALGKLSHDRIDTLILLVSERLNGQKSFDDSLVDIVFDEFIAEDEKHSDTLKARTLGRGIGVRETGRLKTHLNYLTHQLTAIHIQKALSQLSSDSVICMAPYFSGRRDTSFAAFCERESLPRYLSTPLVKKIFFPVGDGSHWRGVLIEKDKKQLTIKIFDSYGLISASRIQDEMERLVGQCLKHTDSHVKLKKTRAISPPIAQTNGHSCGHYVVAFAHYLFKEEQARGYSDSVVQSYQGNQEKITQAVIDYHDSLFGEVPPAVEADRGPSKFKSSGSFFRCIYPKPQPLSVNVSHLLQMPEQQPQVLPVREEASRERDKSTFHQRFGGKEKSIEDRLRQRQDVKKLQEIIDNMQDSFKSSCFFWLHWASVYKASELQKHLDSFVKQSASEGMHVLDDDNLAKTIDSYRYFGFFNHLIHKKTNTRIALEQEMSNLELAKL